ncbi:hypothetical protein GCM10027425_07780 [Alteromonas gracilis]
MTRMHDRFTGRILGAGSTSGLRLVVGRWDASPWGVFADVMVATAEGRRVLLAPDERVAAYVAATYSFDEVVIAPVEVVGEGRWSVRAGPLRVEIETGTRTRLGRLLRLVPGPLARSRVGATLADPVARLVMRGVRTRGSAGSGRVEHYGAVDQHAVTALRGTWGGADLGVLAPVDPPPDFGFSSTPPTPSLVSVTTTVSRDRDVLGDGS